MESIKPELYYDEKGNPKGYRVGIHDGVYGTCPFCGKLYTEEDIKDSDKINFEHVFSRFAIKKATDEKKVFSKLESDFMVAVHKACNDKYGVELEEKVSRILKNFNKPGAKLTKTDADILFKYFKKTIVFLRWMKDWGNLDKAATYEDYDEKTQELRIFYAPSNKERSLYYDIQTIHSKMSSAILLFYDEIIISYMCGKPGISPGYALFEGLYLAKEKDIIVYADCDNWRITKIPPLKKFTDKNKLSWRLSNDDSNYILRFLNEFWRHYKTFDALPSIDELKTHFENKKYTDSHILQRDHYFNLQKRLSRGGQPRKEDCGIVFYKKGKFYFVDNDKLLDISTLNARDLYNKKLEGFIVKNCGITTLPDLSHLVLMFFDCSYNQLTSLKGAPKEIANDFYCNDNYHLRSLEYCPKKVGGNFNCNHTLLKTLKYGPQEVGGDFECLCLGLESLKGAPVRVKGSFITGSLRLTTLEGAPQYIGSDFYCDSDKLKSLKGAPTEIGGKFTFRAKELESLDYLPRAKEYCVLSPYTGETQLLFSTKEQLFEWFKKYKKQRNINKIKSRINKLFTFSIGTKKVELLHSLIDAKYKTKTDNQHEM